jgi:hypothetical protein
VAKVFFLILLVLQHREVVVEVVGYLMPPQAVQAVQAVGVVVAVIQQLRQEPH